MPLTRNLYELDEVIAALQLCLLRKWSRAVFWLWELVVSEETETANMILIDIWLRAAGGYDVSLFKEIGWWERCVRVIAAIQRATSENAERLLERSFGLPGRLTMTPLASSKAARDRRAKRSAAFVASLTSDETINRKEAASWWISFDAACRQHHMIDACWLLQAVQPILSADAIWSAIKIAARGSVVTKDAIALLQGLPTQDQQPLAQANAVILLCKPTIIRETDVLTKPPDLPSYRRDWITWTANAGRRSARIHTIPAEALQAGTSRGSIPAKYTNIADVRDPVALLAEGCRFWKTALTTICAIGADETVVFPNDDVMEAFYVQYFPDDIPDEWSAVDQERSHGRGCMDVATPFLKAVAVREEPVARAAWVIATHVRNPL
jgi:hypothetical protein